ncbi:MAG: helix-turn-helix transcriptional regulator [Armatimonadetes bacterium]|nr:helix-turn-helix transcriptional regulator [Armatimonadota bacterium]
MTLVHDCGATHRGVQLSLDFLIAQGFVDRNPGYGHPLRPEIILNERLLVIESNLVDLFSPKQWKGEVGKNVWDFALLQSLTEYNGRYTEIRDSLPGITDRALSQRLKALESDGLVWRSITANVRPPRPTYSLSESGTMLAGRIERLVKEVGHTEV